MTGWLLLAGALLIAVGVFGYTWAMDRRARDAVDADLSPDRDWDISDLFESECELTREFPAIVDEVNYGYHSADRVKIVVGYVARHAMAVPG